MNEDQQQIDQSKLAESIAATLHIEFQDQFLIKPLDPIKVKKEFTKLPEKKPTTDKDGVSAIDVNDNDVAEKEIKEVDSDIRTGIIISVPSNYKNLEETSVVKQFPNLKAGSKILFRDRAGMPFDLLKDSKLLRIYDILGVYTK